MVVHMLLSASSIQIDIDDPSVKRSVNGALHFRPGSTKTITGDEWEYIAKHHSTQELGMVPLCSPTPTIEKTKTVEVEKNYKTVEVEKNYKPTKKAYKKTKRQKVERTK